MFFSFFDENHKSKQKSLGWMGHCVLRRPIWAILFKDTKLTCIWTYKKSSISLTVCCYGQEITTSIRKVWNLLYIIIKVKYQPVVLKAGPKIQGLIPHCS